MAPTTTTRRTPRPDWARTHHTKPRRQGGRRERDRARRIVLADPAYPEAGWTFAGGTR